MILMTLVFIGAIRDCVKARILEARVADRPGQRQDLNSRVERNRNCPVSDDDRPI